MFLFSASPYPADRIPYCADLHSLHGVRGARLDVALHSLGVRAWQGWDG